MKLYFVRAGRYVVRMLILIALVILLLYLTGTLDPSKTDVLRVLFFSRGGLLLLTLLIVLAAIYPKLSFTTVDIRGDMRESREAVINSFAVYGYSLVSENEVKMIFRATKPMKRILMQWDDPVTVTQDGSYISIEGLKKVVTRVELRLNAFLSK